MAGRKSLVKGKKGEREFYELCKNQGLIVKKTAEDPLYPDLEVNGLSVEIKYRAGVPKALYRWLEEKGAEVLAVKRISMKDRNTDWLVVMRADLFFNLIKKTKL